MCPVLRFRDKRFTTFPPGAHTLAGEPDRGAQDFCTEGMILQAEAGLEPGQS